MDNRRLSEVVFYFYHRVLVGGFELSFSQWPSLAQARELTAEVAAQRDVSAEMNAAAATVAAEVEAITALQRDAEAWSARFEAARHDGTTADAAALDALLREAEALEVRPPKGAGEEASSS